MVGVARDRAAGDFGVDAGAALAGVRLALAVAGGAAAVVFTLGAGYDAVVVAGTALGGTAVVITAAQATWGIALQARLRLGWLSLLEVARQLVIVALTVALVLAGAALLPLLAVPVAAAIAVLGATMPLVRRTIPLVPLFAWQKWVEVLRVTFPYAAATAVGVFYGYLSIVVLSLVASEEETGYFGASFRIYVVLGGLAGPLVAAAFPILARAAADDRARLAYGLQRLWDVSLIIGAGLALVVGLAAELVIEIIAGDGFERAVRALHILAASLLVTYVIVTWGYALLALARYRALLLANALALAVSATLSLALSPTYGATGAAVATLVAEITLAVAYGVALMLHSPELRVSPRLLPRIMLAAGVAAAMFIVPLPVPIELRAALALVVYGAALFVVRAVPPEIGNALSSRLRPAA